MDETSLLDKLEQQERDISQLEQELADLQSGGPCHSSEEADRLRQANDKLRYRINILRRATERELQCPGEASSRREISLIAHHSLGTTRSDRVMLTTDTDIYSDNDRDNRIDNYRDIKSNNDRDIKRDRDNKIETNEDTRSDGEEDISQDGLPSCPPHLSPHLNPDNVNLPFLIKYNKGVGRYVVAARDIKPNEVIFNEFYLISSLLSS